MNKITASAAGGAMPSLVVTVPSAQASMSRSMNRRATLGVLASLPALSIPVSAACACRVDPIFAAIERQREAEAALVETINPADATWRQHNGDEYTEAACATLEAALAASQDAMEAMLDMPPRTIAGLRALIVYVLEMDDAADEYSGRVLSTLLKSSLLNI